MQKEKLVPKRRFYDFIDKWKKYKLKELVELENGYAFKSKYFQSNITKEIVLTPGNIKVGGGFQKGKGHYYANEEYPIKKIMNPGDIFVTMTDLTPTAQTLGFPAIIPDDGNNYLHNQRLGKLLNYNLDKNYLFNLLCTKNYHSQIVNNASVTTVKHTSPDRILNSTVSIPQIKEQQKIGQFFKNLDEMIALEQRKIDKTKSLKSAYLAEMFPAEGERVPKRRFEGFADEWEKVKLGKKYEFFKGKGLPLNSFYEGSENPSIAYGHLYTKYSEIIKNVHLSSEDEGVLSKRGDILFPGSSTVPNGTAQSNAIMLDDIQLGGDIIIGRNYKNDVYTPFLSYQINSKKEKMYPIITGTTITHMYSKDLEKLKYSFPSFDEQVKISKFFESLDHLVIFHQQKLDKLKATKQAYLHEMFV